MSEFYQSHAWDVYDDQKQLSEALADNDLEEFQLALDMGADPLNPNDNGVCVYELALSTYGRAEFVEECLQNGCSPHYVSNKIEIHSYLIEKQQEVKFYVCSSLLDLIRNSN